MVLGPTVPYVHTDARWNNSCHSILIAPRSDPSGVGKPLFGHSLTVDRCTVRGAHTVHTWKEGHNNSAADLEVRLTSQKYCGGLRIPL